MKKPSHTAAEVTNGNQTLVESHFPVARKRSNTTWRHQPGSVVYLWTSVFLCLLQSNNHAIMYRKSRYLLKLHSYQIRHAETA